jgi:hypothetical protein
MAQMAGNLDVPIMIGVGAAFDYIAGSKPHAPTYLRHCRPRVAVPTSSRATTPVRRYLVGNVTFLWLLARERLVGPSRPSGKTSPGDLASDRFIRLRRIQALLPRGRLGPDLRWLRVSESDV